MSYVHIYTYIYIHRYYIYPSQIPRVINAFVAIERISESVKASLPDIHALPTLVFPSGRPSEPIQYYFWKVASLSIVFSCLACKDWKAAAGLSSRPNVFTLHTTIQTYFSRKKVCACWRVESWLGICAGSIFHVHFAWQVCDGQIIIRFSIQ